MKKKAEYFCPPGFRQSAHCVLVSKFIVQSIVERVNIIRLGGCAQPGRSEEAVRGED